MPKILEMNVKFQYNNEVLKFTLLAQMSLDQMASVKRFSMTGTWPSGKVSAGCGKCMTEAQRMI